MIPDKTIEKNIKEAIRKILHEEWMDEEFLQKIEKQFLDTFGFTYEGLTKHIKFGMEQGASFEEQIEKFQIAGPILKKQFIKVFR